jgi:capping protein beta
MRLRNMEIKANRAFTAYHELYMPGSIFSVYVWTIDSTIFGFALITKNEVNTRLRTGQSVQGSLNCSNYVEIDESSEDAKYTLTTSTIVQLSADVGLGQPLLAGGRLEARRETVKRAKSDDDHLVNIGEFIENARLRFRDEVDRLVILKMRQIAGHLTKHGPSEAQKAARGRGPPKYRLDLGFDDLPMSFL